MSVRYTIYIIKMRFQYMSSSFYREIHLLRFICCYCTLIYKLYVISICFICNHHKTLFISQISNQCLCDIFENYFLLQTSTATTPPKALIIVTHKTLKDGALSGISQSCSGRSWVYLKSPSSVILRQYTTVTS